MSEVKRASVLFDQGHTRVTDGVSVVSAGAAIPEEAADATPKPPNNDGDDNEQQVQMRAHGHGGAPRRMLSDARDSIIVYKDDAAASAIKALNRQTLQVMVVDDGATEAAATAPSGDGTTADTDDDRNLPLSAYTAAASASAVGASTAAVQLGSQLELAGEAAIPGRSSVRFRPLPCGACGAGAAGQRLNIAPCVMLRCVRVCVMGWHRLHFAHSNHAHAGMDGVEWASPRSVLSSMFNNTGHVPVQASDATDIGGRPHALRCTSFKQLGGTATLARCRLAEQRGRCSPATFTAAAPTPVLFFQHASE